MNSTCGTPVGVGVARRLLQHCSAVWSRNRICESVPSGVCKFATAPQQRNGCSVSVGMGLCSVGPPAENHSRLANSSLGLVDVVNSKMHGVADQCHPNSASRMGAIMQASNFCCLLSDLNGDSEASTTCDDSSVCSVASVQPCKDHQCCEIRRLPSGSVKSLSACALPAKLEHTTHVRTTL